MSFDRESVGDTEESAPQTMNLLLLNLNLMRLQPRVIYQIRALMVRLTKEELVFPERLSSVKKSLKSEMLASVKKSKSQ